MCYYVLHVSNWDHRFNVEQSLKVTVMKSDESWDYSWGIPFSLWVLVVLGYRIMSLSFLSPPLKKIIILVGNKIRILVQRKFCCMNSSWSVYINHGWCKIRIFRGCFWDPCDLTFHISCSGFFFLHFSGT